MRITAFNGAMRGRRSISALMVNTFFEGAQQAGASTEQVFLARKKINHCRACLQCWVKTPGKCSQKDDMNPMLESFLESDIVIIASPVYVENVTGLTKDFLDRLIPLTDPRFEIGRDGYSRHLKRYENTPGIVAMANSGFIEQDAFGVLRLMYPRIARSMNTEFIAGIYKGGGGMLGLDEPALRPMVEEYLQLLREAGQQVASNKKLSAELAEKLEQQIIPTDVYNQQVNMLWDRLMK